MLVTTFRVVTYVGAAGPAAALMSPNDPKGPQPHLFRALILSL
jgi:hypothetical protein